ncbi:MFS general substrate transporter [Dichomitus squalens LYAD-421 SS1]|uniref:MFS general substrate transporter n=1 Tax=Dichomitus squalens (strain LYAD-421) TaxID=732165 RepID=UPI00044152E5|nr:MFS general substrate transporter [Dichomitus squalens LYAD-421 SS1]EJF64656.1 MFS general substrate transporter [Dichomitus squalens LYAD-421 SS1]
MEKGEHPLQNEDTAFPMLTKAQRRKSWLQFGALCMAIYVAGWNDGTTGPLIPRLQEVYHVSYAVVSLIFIANSIGFISGASVYMYLTDRFGFGMMMFVASLIVAVGNALQASGAPFPAFVIGFLFAGFGGAFLDAGSNGYLASLSEDTSTKMGIMHAVYGVGAMCAPLVSTQFASLPRWHLVYLIHIGLVVTNGIVQAFTFKFKSTDECLKEVGQQPHEKTEDSLQGVSKYKQVFRLRAVHLMAFFLLTYVGVEVTIGGWIVTFVINERHGGHSSGYISSGFWGGLTIGRLALLPLNKKLGEWRVIFLYVLLSLGLELIVWLVPSLVGDAVAISFVGFFLGPIFPIVMNHAGSVLPPELISGSIGWMASFGSAGAAVFPFVTGAIASGTSINSLQPLLIAMMGLLLVIWAFVPRHRIKSTWDHSV